MDQNQKDSQGSKINDNDPVKGRYRIWKHLEAMEEMIEAAFQNKPNRFPKISINAL